MSTPRMDVTYLSHLIWLALRDTPFPHFDRAVALLLGIAAVESGLRNMRQIGGGPARGVFQMEPVTAREMHRYLAAHDSFQGLTEARCGIYRFSITALENSVVYAALLVRTLFWVRDPNPLPEATNIAGQASTWKTYYNTAQGKGTLQQYIDAYRTLIAPEYHD